MVTGSIPVEYMILYVRKARVYNAVYGAKCGVGLQAVVCLVCLVCRAEGTQDTQNTPIHNNKKA